MNRRESNIILVGIIAGLVLAGLGLALFGGAMKNVQLLGDIFLLMLRMIIVPLVVATVVHGVTQLGDVRKLRGVGFATIGYYAITTAFAVMLGLFLVLTIRPGDGITVEGVEAAERAVAKAEEDLGFRDIVLSFFHPNIVGAFAEGAMLPVILFSLVFGAVLTTLGEKGKPVIALFEGINAAMMQIVRLIMWFAPVGIFGLVGGKFGEELAAGNLGQTLAGVAMYVWTVVLGVSLHGFVTLTIVLYLITKRNPLRYVAAIAPALMTAFSTASSAATIPMTIESATERAGVSTRSAGFVVPLGATINMDGTALYEAVAAIFIAQAFGIELSMTQIFLVFITATLVSIGAAGIPEAGLFMLVIVLDTVGLPLEGTGLILAVDWFLDRCRTTINVWGDSIGAAVIDAWAGSKSS